MKLTADIGGSKTRINAYHRDGNVEKFCLFGEYGRAEDSENPLKELVERLKKLPLFSERVTYIVVNLGGKNKTQIIHSFARVFPGSSIKVYRESEGTVAFKMAELYDCNVVIMAGTGCIAFARCGRKECVVGGWGKNIGDQGSGYAIGLKAISEALCELDGNGVSYSLMTREITGRENTLSGESAAEYSRLRDEIRSRLPKGRNEIAKLSKTVVKCAEKGCLSARKILSEAGADIARLAVCATKKIGIDFSRVGILINGGLTEFRQWWEKDFFSALNEIISTPRTIFLNDGIDKALKTFIDENNE